MISFYLWSGWGSRKCFYNTTFITTWTRSSLSYLQNLLPRGTVLKNGVIVFLLISHYKLMKTLQRQFWNLQKFSFPKLPLLLNFYPVEAKLLEFKDTRGHYYNLHFCNTKNRILLNFPYLIPIDLLTQESQRVYKCLKWVIDCQKVIPSVFIPKYLSLYRVKI